MFPSIMALGPVLLKLSFGLLIVFSKKVQVEPLVLWLTFRR